MAGKVKTDNNGGVTSSTIDLVLDERLLTKVPKNTDELNKVVRPSLTYWQDAWRKLRGNKVAVVSFVVLIIYVGLSIFAPMLSKYSFSAQDASLKFLSPSLEHWFGTDQAGRDMWTRNWMGARISLFIGFAVVLLNTLIGCVIGGIAGFFGGKADIVIMRVIEVLMGIPMLIVAILLMTVMSKGIQTIIIAMVSIGWVGSARMVRGQVLQLKNSEYVLSARVLGSGSGRIIMRHLIPNVSGILITTMTMAIPGAIFSEAFLSFIGIGVKAPNCSWGSLANEALQTYEIHAYLLIIPAFFICTTVLAFNLLGDGLRDALDPKMRGK